jgi:hypothetical protein
MITRDYIMRMINLLASALARILSLKKAHDFPQALVEIEKAYKQLLGADRLLLHRLSDVQLMELLGSDQALAGSKYYVVGRLLKEEGEILQLQGKNDEGLGLYATSLSLLIQSLLNAESPADANHIATIDTLIEHLQAYEIPVRLRQRLFAYYEFVKRYDKAEDTIFELIDADAGSVQPGIQFYKRLLSKTDEELLQGNLPRTEVEEGLSQLLERTSQSTPNS